MADVLGLVAQNHCVQVVGNTQKFVTRLTKLHRLLMDLKSMEVIWHQVEH